MDRTAGGTPRSKSPGEAPLLVVVDPVARLTDAESVRIARDVLRAGTPGLKLCLPDDPTETPRLLARRGARRPVLVGNDRALLRAVQHLHGERALAQTALSVVPVGNGPSVALARSLGLPLDAVSAARTVLRGSPRALDLLVDEEDGVVLGGLRTEGASAGSSRTPPHREGAPSAGAASTWRRMSHALARTLSSRAHGEAGERGAAPPAPAQRAPEVRTVQWLRVEADGAVVTGPDRPVTDVTVRANGADGLAEVAVHPVTGGPVRVRARSVTVSAPEGFRYRADTSGCGAPVESRTWTVLPRAWHLILPAA
ncbi:hypothetical protein [Streptomyces sp. 891-h]|uniref:hypothetical protein n=1 Tax=unclassified Streptomyces TaxID=2593676 RepID=UPI001FA9653B|nr:hypothetical protein [Streptomyces sp. 891-h]UNZ18260.1 hypothetical protein HC362_15660 [Streptomyces sp. 891-h]